MVGHQQAKGVLGNPRNMASLVAQTVKNPPAVQETWVQSLGQEDPLEKGVATYSSILAWRIPWTMEPSGCSPWGPKELDVTERLHVLSFSFLFQTCMKCFQFLAL